MLYVIALQKYLYKSYHKRLVEDKVENENKKIGFIKHLFSHLNLNKKKNDEDDVDNRLKRETSISG